MSVSAQPINAVLEWGSTEIQTSTAASHVEENAPPRKKLRGAIGFLIDGTHAIGPTTHARHTVTFSQGSNKVEIAKRKSPPPPM